MCAYLVDRALWPQRRTVANNDVRLLCGWRNRIDLDCAVIRIESKGGVDPFLLSFISVRLRKFG
jgi:hypothetical protein